MRGCEIYWDVDKADHMQALIEKATGRECPCKRGETCPILPREVALPTPRWREGSHPAA
jgi:hypothetical protein